jgi:hypothetical protein
MKKNKKKVQRPFFSAKNLRSANYNEICEKKSDRVFTNPKGFFCILTIRLKIFQSKQGIRLKIFHSKKALG